MTKELNWTFCQDCKGSGRKSWRLSKKVRLRHQQELEEFEKSPGEGEPPVLPQRHLSACLTCKGSGLHPADEPAVAEAEHFPHVAIIGGGIGGVALAVACLHRGIPFTLYERDNSFDARSQGYGLTLQQASRAIQALGVDSLKSGVTSTRHVVHTPDGTIVGEWGSRGSGSVKVSPKAKRMNIHIARQDLRLALLEQLRGDAPVQWGHQLVDLNDRDDGTVDLTFEVDGEERKATADLVVGADGIRSSVRSLLIGEETAPLRYLGFLVILGICPLEYLDGLESPLLDSATVFQTVNGNERMYMMPFSADTVMWQMSFPMPEDEAKVLSARGAAALKKEACRRAQWHAPIPQILDATLETQLSGYPVYDRELLKPEWLATGKQVTLIGDAAHPMSPFKGQGANQAILDALALARGIKRQCRPLSDWREAGIRDRVLNEFEAEMLERSARKVKGSKEAAELLHSNVVLRADDGSGGRLLTRKDRGVDC